MIQYGPYNRSDFERIVQALEQLGIEFHHSIDTTRATERTKARHPLDEAHAHFRSDDHNCAYLHLSEKDIHAHANELEKLGIVYAEAPNFDEIDYVCPKCQHHRETPGFCPQHRIALIPWEHKIEQQRQQAKSVEAKVIWILLSFLAIGLATGYILELF